jgi:hypothetical protein
LATNLSYNPEYSGVNTKVYPPPPHTHTHTRTKYNFAHQVLIIEVGLNTTA